MLILQNSGYQEIIKFENTPKQKKKKKEKSFPATITENTLIKVT